MYEGKGRMGIKMMWEMEKEDEEYVQEEWECFLCVCEETGRKYFR